MESSVFFAESTEQSQVKATIVSKYFWAWAKVMISTAKKNPRLSKIAYIDLFCGPGRYMDGTDSTPMLILKKAINDSTMCEMLVTIFNDCEPSNILSLEQAVAALQGIETLQHKPIIQNGEVGESIVNLFESMNLIPTLFFVDPWGYKGLSLRLINSVLKDWGCDCIFFFNYNRINMGISNPFVEEPMNALFGEVNAEALRARVGNLSPLDRELTVVEALCQSLKELGGRYVLPFCFKNNAGNRTSHYLIFVSKHVLGYKIMKEIMAKECSGTEQGVPTFEYAPATPQQSFLFELSRPLEVLADMLLEHFSGQRLTMHQIYSLHNVGKRYIEKNYKDTLLLLEAQKRIEVISTKPNRRNGTMAGHVIIQFP